jgi:ribosomal protein S18 acetylase RimI-like enzyme
VPSIEERAHANYAAFVRFQGRLEPAGSVLDGRGVVAFRGVRDWPGTRMGIRAVPELDAEVAAAEIDDFLLGHGRSAAISVRVGADDDLAAVLAARGFRAYDDTPEMVCESVLPDRAPAAGVTVRLATTAADVRAYAEIAGHAFRHLGLQEDATRNTIDNAEVMLGPDVAIALAEINGHAVAGACSVLFGDGPDGYVGWVACLDDARGRGLGDTVTRAVTNEAFARGAGMVSLEASKFGESTYARMGYRELYRYRIVVKY